VAPGGDPAAVEVRRYRATVAYDGTAYSGFQTQPHRPTVQGALEEALRRATQERVRVQGAGRTDAGVHAHGQVISFSCRWAHGEAVLERAMNALLPEDIAVRELAVADERFHARYSATARLYVYTVYASAVRVPALERTAHRVPTAPDLAAMQAAADALVGERDFGALGQPTVGESRVRRVLRAAWVARPAAGGDWCEAAERAWQFQIEANGFLRGMVRRAVGTLLEVGAGLRPVSSLRELLASGDIARAAPPAPACGLSLWRVTYGALPVERTSCGGGADRRRPE
jgi:tRNA pseudouridine38-40 synthase